MTTPPDKVTYNAGEALDLSGVVVVFEAYNNSGVISSTPVTGQCVYSPADGDALTADDQYIIVTYTEGA